MSEELKVLIASSTTNESLVEVVRFYHPDAGYIYLSDNVIDGTQAIDEHGVMQTVRFANSALTDESSGRILLNERSMTLAGYNDLIADYEDSVIDREIDIEASVISYISDMDGNLSIIRGGPLKYYVQKVKYTQKNSSCVILFSTEPTNQSETGERMTVSRYETLRGFV